MVAITPLLTCGDRPSCAEGEYDRCENIGAIGLATLLATKAEGAGRLVASASRDSRRAVAREVGADTVIDPDGLDPVAATDGGADVAFEAGPLGDRNYETALRLLADGRIGLEGIVNEGFEALLDRTSGHVNILVEP